MTEAEIIQKGLIRIVTRLFYGVTLTVLSIRDYLFGNGLYIYRDWTWPLSTSVLPVANFSPEIARNTGPDPMGFVRMFITWPIAIISNLTDNPVVAEKAYVIYFFSLFIILFSILGELQLRVFNRISGNVMDLWKRELFVFLVVLFCFVNFWSLEQFSDLYFTYIVDFALIGISATLVLLGEGWLRGVLLPGAVLSLCIFLDPNLYPYGLLVVGTTILGKSLTQSLSFNGLLKSASRTLVVFAVTLPALATMLYIFVISSGTNLRPPGSYLQSTENLSLLNSIRLLGYWWSLIAYAPPTIMLSADRIADVDAIGNPSYMLLPPDIVTPLWLLSTWFVPLFALGANLLASLRKVTLPISMVAILGLLFTQPSIFPFPFELAVALKDTPVVGGALVTFLALPDHALVVVAISYTLLVGAGVYWLLSKDMFLGLAKFVRPLRKLIATNFARPSLRQIIPVTVVALLLIFQGWQFFSGSFYPSGYVWGGAGNGVSSVGAFSPSEPPSEMFEVYNWLLSQSDNVNVYWPGPSGAAYPWSPKATGSIAFLDAPKPTVFPRALPYLLRENLTANVRDYLASLNIRFLVVQPFSGVAMQFAWGVEDVTSLNQILRSTPGIAISKEAGEITVYEVDNTWGSIYSSLLVGTANRDDLRYAVAYKVFSSLGTRIALTGPAVTSSRLCIDKLPCTFSIISPAEFGFESSSKTSLRVLNNTDVGLDGFVLNSDASRTLPDPWTHWSVTNWGPGDATVGIESGTMLWTFNGHLSYLSLSYNGTVTTGNPGGLIIPPGLVAVTRIGFWYRTSPTFDGTVQIVVPQLTRTGVTIAEPVSSVHPSTEWSYASFNSTLPLSTAYYTARIVGQASTGWMETRDVRIDLALFQRDTNAPFGYSVSLSKTPLDLDLYEGYSFIEFEGSGTIQANDQTFELDSPDASSWYAIFSPSTSSARLSGELVIRSLLFSSILPEPGPGDHSTEEGLAPSITVNSRSAVVFARPFVVGNTLKSVSSSYKAHSSLDGLNVFLDVAPGTYSVSLEGIDAARFGYFASLSMIFGIVTLSAIGKLEAFRRLKVLFSIEGR